jgi:hypothetical protein
MSTTADRLVSTTVLRDALAELREKQTEDAPWMAPEARARGEWAIARIEKALRDAEREFVSVTDAARLTHWDAKTLYKYARAAHAGDALPEEWAGLIARFDGGRWSLCLSTVPYRPARAA